ncbi:MAG TPA: RHS repeat-associated core domain-containing protein [Bryobacteraceae bacterium]|nr:RHS repeat-associated core domain-containing protein [Bryobacteraceae bacterium]
MEDYGGTNATTAYSYNALDELISVNQSGQMRNFVYDTMGRLTLADNPESRTGAITCPSAGLPGVCYGYDQAGNLKTRTDTRGVTTTYNYDALNRVISESSSDGTLSAGFQYDCTGVNGCAINNETGANYPIGRMSAATSSAGNVTATSIYRYDALGRAAASQETVVTGSDTAGPFGFHYDYVPAGISKITYPSGRQVTTTYNQASQPNALTGYASNVQYWEHGALKQLELGNGVRETWSYNSRLQPATITTANASTGANLLTLGYGYSSGTGANGGATNNVGNVLSQTITPGASSPIYEAYAYDHFDRLTVASEYASLNTNPTCPDGTAVWCQQFSHGTYGNALTTSVNLGIQSPAGFDANNHNSPHNGLETHTVCNAGNSGWCYDNAGNLVRDLSNQTYAYNADGQIVAVCPNQTDPAACTNAWNTGQIVYSYDAEGRRVQSHLGDGSKVIYVYDAMGQLAAEYGDTNTATGTQYLTADPLGSTRMVSATVNGSPCATARMDYLPYGFVVPFSFSNRTNVSDCGAYTYQQDGGVRQKFTAKERDAETGLDYFGARYYSGAQGRWTSPDQPFADQHPEDPQSWNMYAYVRNNPLAHVDPNGKACSALNNSSGFCQRADLYTNLDMLVGSKTRFFAAASAASQELADVAVPGFGAMAASPGTRAFLESTGQALQKVNLESAGQILSGQMTGSEEALDRSMVHREQTAVQKQLDQLKGANPEGYGTAIKEINTLLNDTGAKTQGLVLGGNLLFSTDKAYSTFLGGVRKSLGHNIDFANQKDREAIGNALVQHIRNGGCDVTRDKVTCH